MDLSRDVPRSPYEKLGGIVFVPRGIDKGRADLAGTLGEYECLTARSARLFEFLGISSGASGCRPRRSCTAPTSINGRSRTGSSGATTWYRRGSGLGPATPPRSRSQPQVA